MNINTIDDTSSNALFGFMPLGQNTILGVASQFIPDTDDVDIDTTEPLINTETQPYDSDSDSEVHTTSYADTDNNIHGEIQNLINRYMMRTLILENQDQPNILHASLNQEHTYKRVISKEGKQLLISTIYSNNICSNDNCPISQDDFKEGDKITVLPCNHGFTSGTVEKWLETQTPECPICRYRFDSIEIKNEDYKDISVLENTQPNNLSASRNVFLNSLRLLENVIHPFGRTQILNTIPHSYIENMYNNNNNNNRHRFQNIYRSEEVDLNEAIMNSLRDVSMSYVQR